jgi:hypothetical protein
MTTQPALPKILKGILNTDEKERQSKMRVQERINFRSSIDKQMRKRKENGACS